MLNMFIKERSSLYFLFPLAESVKGATKLQNLQYYGTDYMIRWKHGQRNEATALFYKSLSSCVIDLKL